MDLFLAGREGHIMSHWKKSVRHACNDITAFLKWTACACVIGTIMGGLGTLFHLCMKIANDTRGQHGWLLWLLPLGGAAIALLYRVCGMEQDQGTNLVITSVRSTERISIKTAPLIFVSTFLTHLLGGSSGREGAALQMGGSVAAQIGRWLHLDEKDERIIIMCGMSAAFSALFGAPISAAIFSMEVISVGVMYYAAIVPCVLAAVIGFSIAHAFGVPATAFTITGIPEVGAASIGQVVLLAAICAGISVIFCKLMHFIGGLYRKVIPDSILRAAVGGALVVALSYLFCTRDYNGAGMPIIYNAMNGQARPEAFLLKMLFTAITLGAGFKGGEIVPTFFVGATFGCVAGGLLGLNPSFGAAVGLIAMFCGVVNCPVTSLILSVELFGAEGILLFGIACAVSYMLSGYYGLYSGQKILYSKIKPEFVNWNSK